MMQRLVTSQVDATRYLLYFRLFNIEGVPVSCSSYKGQRQRLIRMNFHCRILESGIFLEFNYYINKC